MNASHLDGMQGPEFRKLKGDLRRAKGSEAKRAVKLRVASARRPRSMMQGGVSIGLFGGI